MTVLADEILVIDGGRLMQAGTRAEVYSRPASPQVARLLGIQNLDRATVTAAGHVEALVMSAQEFASVLAEPEVAHEVHRVAEQRGGVRTAA